MPSIPQIINQQTLALAFYHVDVLEHIYLLPGSQLKSSAVSVECQVWTGRVHHRMWHCNVSHGFYWHGHQYLTAIQKCKVYIVAFFECGVIVKSKRCHCWQLSISTMLTGLTTLWLLQVAPDRIFYDSFIGQRSASWKSLYHKCTLVTVWLLSDNPARYYRWIKIGNAKLKKCRQHSNAHSPWYSKLHPPPNHFLSTQHPGCQWHQIGIPSSWNLTSAHSKQRIVCGLRKPEPMFFPLITMLTPVAFAVKLKPNIINRGNPNSPEGP